MSAPTRTQTPLDDALEHIAVEDVVWIRLAAIKQDDAELTAYLLELVSGAAPPDWKPTVWQYPAAIFIALDLTGAEVAKSLRDGQISAEGHLIRLPELQAPVRWDRNQSGSAGTYQPLEWPSTEARLLSGGSPQFEPQGHLLPVGIAPSFLNMYTATASFFWMGKHIPGGALYQAVVYRHQDRRARITHVRIGHDHLEVRVDGAAVDGITVELPGDSPGPSKQIWEDPINPTQTISFELEDRLPAGSWLVLRKGSEWIDRRFLTVPWSREHQSGIEYVVELSTRLESLVASRERDQLEFKRQVPSEMDGKARLMKTVCAFANGQGGSVLIGVDDDRNIIGLGPSEVGRISDQLTEMIGTWVHPRPRVEFFDIPIGDGPKVVLEMWVHLNDAEVSGSGRPGETEVAYVRHHGVTEKASLLEIKALFAARPGATGGSINGFG